MIRALWKYALAASRLASHQRKHGALPCQQYSDCDRPAGHREPHTHGRPCPERNPVAGWPCLRRSPEHLVHRDGHGAEWHLIGQAELDPGQTDWLADELGQLVPTQVRRQRLRWRR